MPQERRKIGFRGEANPPEKKSDAPKNQTRVGFGLVPADQSVPHVSEDGEFRVPGIGRDLSYRVQSRIQAVEEEQKRFLAELREFQKEADFRLLINAVAGDVFQAYRNILIAMKERHAEQEVLNLGDWILLADSVLANFQKEVQEGVDLFDEKQKTRSAFEHDLKRIQAEAERQYRFIADRLERCP